MAIVNKIKEKLKTPSMSQIIMTEDVISLMKVVQFLSVALQLMHDNAWHYEEGYDETDMCKRNIRALKSADVPEYCGKWDMEEENDGSTGTDSDKEGA